MWAVAAKRMPVTAGGTGDVPRWLEGRRQLAVCAAAHMPQQLTRCGPGPDPSLLQPPPAAQAASHLPNFPPLLLIRCV